MSWRRVVACCWGLLEKVDHCSHQPVLMSCRGEISWLHALGPGAHEVRTSLSLSRRCSHEAAPAAGRQLPLSCFEEFVSHSLAFRTNKWRPSRDGSFILSHPVKAAALGTLYTEVYHGILVPHGNLGELLPAAMFRSSAAEPLRKEGIP